MIDYYRHIHDHACQVHDEIIPFIITTTSSCVEDKWSIGPQENDSLKDELSMTCQLYKKEGLKWVLNGYFFRLVHISADMTQSIITK